MARKAIECPYPDCFSCPYPDCVRETIPKPDPVAALFRKKYSKNRPSVPPKRRQLPPPDPNSKLSRYMQLPEEVKEEYRATARNWYHNNKDRAKAAMRKYQSTHLEERRERDRKRRAKKRMERSCADDGQKHLSDGKACQRPDARAGG